MICPMCGHSLRSNKGWAALFYEGYCNTCDTPVERGLRFTEEEVDYAMSRLEDIGGIDKQEVLRILREWDRGVGDIDDVIDEWENSLPY